MFTRSGALALALACLAPVALHAQNTATGTVPEHATIGAVVTLSNPTALEFGTLLAGQTSTEVPPLFSSAAAHAGSIQVSFSDPINLSVTIDPGGELANQGHTLTTSLTCGAGSSATDANAVSIDCQSQHLGGSLQQAATRSTRTAFLFIGGHTTAGDDAPAGAYSGSITVRVTVTTQ